MAENISGVYLHLEGTNANLPQVQYARETAWDTASGAYRYIDNSSGVHYIYEHPSFNQLSDVEYNLAVSGNLIQYNGTNWVPISGDSLNSAKKYVETFDDSDLDVSNNITITHDFENEDVIVQVYDDENNMFLPTNISIVDANSISLDFTMDISDTPNNFKVVVYSNDGAGSGGTPGGDGDSVFVHNYEELKAAMLGTNRSIFLANEIYMEQGIALEVPSDTEWNIYGGTLHMSQSGLFLNTGGGGIPTLNIYSDISLMGDITSPGDSLWFDTSVDLNLRNIRNPWGYAGLNDNNGAASGGFITYERKEVATVTGSFAQAFWDNTADIAAPAGWETLTTGITYCRRNGIVFVKMLEVATPFATGLTRLPDGYRPAEDQPCNIIDAGAGQATVITVEATGELSTNYLGNSVIGMFSYPAEQ